jgi:type IV pilus assembly protein PilO
MALDFKDFSKLKWYYQVLIVGAICGGLLAGFWYQYLTPIQTEIVAKTTKVTELQQIVAKNEARQKELEKFKKEALELQDKLETLKAVLPLEKETDQIFRAVQLQASASGLKVSRVAPRATIDHDVYTEYPIDLDVTGTYHNVGAFLDRIRQLPRIVNINGLRLQGRASEGEQAFTSSIGATYTATTFVYKEEPAVPTAPPPNPVK